MAAINVIELLRSFFDMVLVGLARQNEHECVVVLWLLRSRLLLGELGDGMVVKRVSPEGLWAAVRRVACGSPRGCGQLSAPPSGLQRLHSGFSLARGRGFLHRVGCHLGEKGRQCFYTYVSQ